MNNTPYAIAPLSIPHLNRLGFDLAAHAPFTGQSTVRCSGCTATVIDGIPAHGADCRRLALRDIEEAVAQLAKSERGLGALTHLGALLLGSTGLDKAGTAALLLLVDRAHNGYPATVPVAISAAL